MYHSTKTKFLFQSSIQLLPLPWPLVKVTDEVTCCPLRTVASGLWKVVGSTLVGVSELVWVSRTSALELGSRSKELWKVPWNIPSKGRTVDEDSMMFTIELVSILRVVWNNVLDVVSTLVALILVEVGSSPWTLVGRTLDESFFFSIWEFVPRTRMSSWRPLSVFKGARYDFWVVFGDSGVGEELMVSSLEMSVMLKAFSSWFSGGCSRGFLKSKWGFSELGLGLWGTWGRRVMPGWEIFLVLLLVKTFILVCFNY